MLKIITLFCTRSILYHLLLCLPITRIHSHLQNYVGSQHYSPIFGSIPPLWYFMDFLECVYVFVTSLRECKTVNPRQKILLVQPPVQSDWRNHPKYEANKVTKTVNFPWHCFDVYVWLDIPWSANDRLSPLGFLLQIFSPLWVASEGTHLFGARGVPADQYFQSLFPSTPTNTHQLPQEIGWNSYNKIIILFQEINDGSLSSEWFFCVKDSFPWMRVQGKKWKKITWETFNCCN